MSPEGSEGNELDVRVWYAWLPAGEGPSRAHASRRLLSRAGGSPRRQLIPSHGELFVAIFAAWAGAATRPAGAPDALAVAPDQSSRLG